MMREDDRDERGEGVPAPDTGPDEASPEARDASPRDEPGTGTAGAGGGAPPGAEAPAGSGEIPPGPPPDGGHRPGLPWEAREREGALSSALSTLRMALLEPTKAFRRMRQTGQLGDAIVFLLIFGTLGAFFGLLWQSWTRAMLGSSFGADLEELAALNISAVFMLFLAPVFVFIGSLIYAVVAHLVMLVFGGAPQPLETTWKVVCYATGAAYVFNVLPVCGNLISTVWAIVVVIIGLREAQEIPGGRAAAAVLVPLVLVCACLMLAAIVAVSLGMAVAGLG